MAIEDAAWFLLFFELVYDTLASSVEFFDVLAEHGEAIKDDTWMLVLCIVDEGKDEIDALAHAGDQLPTSLQSLSSLVVAFL